MSMNSGYNTVDAIPLASRPLIHIGQDEVRAGQTVAQELIATGARRAVCINDDITDSTKALRCKSFDSEFERLNGTVKKKTPAHGPLLVLRLLGEREV